jgi:hypothetical protein
MRALNRGLSIAGPAITAVCAPGDNLMMDRALYLAQRGDVLVVVTHAENSGAQWGDVAAHYAVAKGLAGVILQGCIRDTDTLERMRFPVWSTLLSPSRPAKSGHGWVNTPVSCDVSVSGSRLEARHPECEGSAFVRTRAMRWKTRTLRLQRRWAHVAHGKGKRSGAKWSPSGKRVVSALGGFAENKVSR